MMETTTTVAAAAAGGPGQDAKRCNPHLKKVLKSYQLSAQRSLHGPGQSAKLATSVLVSRTAPPASPSPAAGKTSGRAGADDGPPASPGSSPRRPPSRPSPPSSASGPDLPPAAASPRPFIHSAPLPCGEDGSAERADTGLEGEDIACFVVGGEKRLCLPQVLNSVLRDFNLPQIHSVCDALRIYCSRCNAEQLGELQATGALPATAASCGLITQTDAERLCAALLTRGLRPGDDFKPATGDGFHVYHECFGKARGVCRPSEPLHRSIQCTECRLLFGPQHFVTHGHRAETHTVHWGFDSSNWRTYLLLAENQEGQEELRRRLDAYKQQAGERLKRKQMDRVTDSPLDVESGDKYDGVAGSEAAVHLLKKSRLDDGAGGGVLGPALAAAQTTYLPYPDPYLYWYEPWGLSAFRPWPSIFTATKDGKTAPLVPPHFLRDSFPPASSYLAQSQPMLLHPERVVPLAEYDRHERSYQPNVALMAVANQDQPEEKYSHVDVTSTEDEDSARTRDTSRSPSRAVSTITLNPSRRSPSPSSAPSSSLPPPPTPLRASSSSAATPSSVLAPPVSSKVPSRTRSPALKVKTEIEMSSDTEDSASESSVVDNTVAAVLESLSSDERDARMAKVLRSLVKRLGDVEKERGRLMAENEVLRKKSELQEAEIIQQKAIIQRLEEQQERLSSKQHDPEAFQDKVMAMEKELRTLRSEVNRLPNGRHDQHDNIRKPEISTNSEDNEPPVPARRDSVETNNIAVSVIHKSESHSLSGTE